MSRFRVKITRVSVSDLETRLSKHLPDVKYINPSSNRRKLNYNARERICPFVKFNFDNFKAYKTEMTIYKGNSEFKIILNNL